MRPISHPALEDITVEGILHALSDPVRVYILAQIVSSACPQICSAFLSSGPKTLPKSTLSHHFKILREAGLIRSARHGVELRNTPRCEEIASRFPGLLPAILKAHQIQSTSRPKKTKRR